MLPRPTNPMRSGGTNSSGMMKPGPAGSARAAPRKAEQEQSRPQVQELQRVADFLGSYAGGHWHGAEDLASQHELPALPLDCRNCDHLLVVRTEDLQDPLRPTTPRTLLCRRGAETARCCRDCP